MSDNTINNDLTMSGATGTLLAGRYCVVKQLGQGGMGSVWLAAVLLSALAVVALVVVLTEYKCPKPSDMQTIMLPGGVPMTFCWCSATTSPDWKRISGGNGYFLMGSPEGELGRSDNEKRHPVKLTHGFWIAQTPVTQRQYEAVTGTNPTKFDKGPDIPVSDATWTDCETFCRQLAAIQGDGSRFGLPTEAQWEYACRAGTTTALNNGKALTTKGGACPNLDAVVWYRKNSGGDKHPVKGKRVNAWNLYDMHGNVWEWCPDYYGSYGEGMQVDPAGAASGSIRVNRGGCYLNFVQNCRSDYRNYNSEGVSGSCLGFRPVSIRLVTGQAGSNSACPELRRAETNMLNSCMSSMRTAQSRARNLL